VPAIRRRIIGRVEHNPTAVRVLVFLAHNSQDWFDVESIQTGASTATHPLGRLLDELVDDGFLRRTQAGEMALYALTKHREVREAALYLSERERQALR
jgi:hypothetical protein